MTIEELMNIEGVKSYPSLKTTVLKFGPDAGNRKIKFSCEIILPVESAGNTDIMEAFQPFFKDNALNTFVKNIVDNDSNKSSE